MTTIKIKSSHPSQGDFVIINAADFDAEKHDPFDQESHDALRGAVQSGGLLPSAREVLAARDQLLTRSDELDDRELQLNQRALSLDGREQQLLEREQANAAEAQRLADMAAAQAAGAGATDYGSMTKEQLQGALKDQGKDYLSTATKADLIALLTTA
jgi:hypothetical protein